MTAFNRRSLLGIQPAGHTAPVRLPWTLSEAAFIDGCSRCRDCLPVCPTGIIQRGDGGFPVLDFRRGDCSFCGACVDACREPLFQARSEKPFAHVMQIGSNCLPKQGVECRSCGESCEVQAIRFQFNARRLAEPQLDTELCSGCGACVAVCPADAISLLTLSPTDCRTNEVRA